MSESCGNCRFVVRDNTSAGLRCRRFPPALVMAVAGGERLALPGKPQAMNILYDFPPVRADSWCGEFARKEQMTWEFPPPNDPLSADLADEIEGDIEELR